MGLEAIQRETMIDRALQQYGVQDSAIAEMRDKYMPLKVDGIEDRKGLLIVREARMQVKGVRVAVEKWVAENGDQIKAILDERLSHGLASAVVKAFDEMLFSSMMNLRQEIAEKVNGLRNG